MIGMIINDYHKLFVTSLFIMWQIHLKGTLDIFIIYNILMKFDWQSIDDYMFWHVFCEEIIIKSINQSINLLVDRILLLLFVGSTI